MGGPRKLVHQIGVRAFRLACALVASLSAVAPTILTAQAARIRDSAGIRIVENVSRTSPPTVFRLADRASFDVGGLESDPAMEFGSRQGYFRGIRLNDSRVVVLDEIRVHWFDSTGKRLRIVGRQGSGPGEFRQVYAICSTRGDTIVVSDGVARRGAVFDQWGGFVRHVSYTPHGIGDGQFCFDDGTFMVMRISFSPAATQTALLSRLRLDGTLANVVAELDFGSEDRLTYREPAAAAQGRSVYFNDAITYDIKVMSADGRLTTIIRTSDAPHPITLAELDNFRPPSSKTASASDAKAAMAQYLSESKLKTWPTYRKLLVDPTGRVWALEWNKPGVVAPDVRTAFDASGRLVGQLTIPAPPPRTKRNAVVHFGRDEVFMARFDDDGAIHLTAYQLIRAPR